MRIYPLIHIIILLAEILYIIVHIDVSVFFPYAPLRSHIVHKIVVFQRSSQKILHYVIDMRILTNVPRVIIIARLHHKPSDKSFF